MVRVAANQAEKARANQNQNPRVVVAEAEAAVDAGEVEAEVVGSRATPTDAARVADRVVAKAEAGSSRSKRKSWKAPRMGI